MGLDSWREAHRHLVIEPLSQLLHLRPGHLHTANVHLNICTVGMSNVSQMSRPCSKPAIDYFGAPAPYSAGEPSGSVLIQDEPVQGCCPTPSLNDGIDSTELARLKRVCMLTDILAMPLCCFTTRGRVSNRAARVVYRIVNHLHSTQGA